MELKKEPSKTLIYVSNLPFDTTDEQFRDLFKGFTVRTAYVARRKNGRSKGFGFANLDKETEQNAAIEKLNGFELSSRKLIAKVAMNDDRRNEKGELKEEFKSQLPPRSTPSETVAHVSNLEWTVNDEELRKIFAEFNPKVATVATRRNGRSKGYGFVEFNTKDELEKAVKLNGTTVSGRQITVQVSVKRTSTPNNNRDNNNRRPNRNSTRRTGGNNNNNRDNNRGGNNRNNNNRDNNSNRGGNNNNFNVVRRTERRSENTLYISNLPFELDDNDLKQIFQEFQPKNAQIPLRRNGKSRGYGFVEFSNAKDQNAALTALDQSEVNGRVVTIKVSSPNANRDNNNNRDNNRVTVNRRNNNNRGNNNRDNNRGNNRGGNNNNNNNNNRGNNNRDNNRNNNNNNRGGNNNNNNNNNNRRQPRENRPPRENREVSTNLVYVSNLPFNLEDNGLGEIFKGLKVNKAYVARRRNGYSKGFGFVEFATTEDQQNALKQNGSEVSGRPIVVQAAFKVDEKTN